MDIAKTFRLLIYGPAMCNIESTPVMPEDYDSLAELRSYMMAVMRRGDGIGLAAPQVGVFKQVVLLELNGKVQDLVNPQITRMYGKEEEGMEGCLSLPPPGNGCLVPRMHSVDVEASTVRHPATVKKFTFHNLPARIVQHELDHLTGTFFVDRVVEKKRREVLERFANWKGARDARVRFAQKGNNNVDAAVFATHGARTRLS
jgi:peptide deformylase